MLFEEGQSASLRRTLEILLASEIRRQEVGARGREFALRHYTSESVAARYLDAFERARHRAMPGKQMLSEAVTGRKA
jgi:hypothetical protein